MRRYRQLGSPPLIHDEKARAYLQYAVKEFKAAAGHWEKGDCRRAFIDGQAAATAAAHGICHAESTGAAQAVGQARAVRDEINKFLTQVIDQCTEKFVTTPEIVPPGKLLEVEGWRRPARRRRRR